MASNVNARMRYIVWCLWFFGITRQLPIVRLCYAFIRVCGLNRLIVAHQSTKIHTRLMSHYPHVYNWSKLNSNVCSFRVYYTIMYSDGYCLVWKSTCLWYADYWDIEVNDSSFTFSSDRNDYTDHLIRLSIVFNYRLFIYLLDAK